MTSPLAIRAFGGYALLVLVAMKFSQASAQTAEPFGYRPVEKVIEILEGLHTQVQNEGKQEATEYAEFACHCRDSTTKISNFIKECEDLINDYSAKIEEKSSELDFVSKYILKRKAQVQESEKKLAAEKKRFAEEKAKYDLEVAELDRGHDGVAMAIDTIRNVEENIARGVTTSPAFLEISKNVKGGDTSFLEVSNKVKTVRQSLKQGKSPNLLALGKELESVTALVQRGGVDPNDPDYKFKSQSIIDAMGDLMTEINERKNKVDYEFGLVETASTGPNGLQVALQFEIDAFNEEIVSNTEKQQTLTAEIAGHKEDLTTQEGIMSDDKEYLEGLTEQCEARAADWDQRTRTREDELKELVKVIDIMGGVKEADQVNERAMLQQTDGKDRKSVV